MKNWKHKALIATFGLAVAVGYSVREKANEADQQQKDYGTTMMVMGVLAGASTLVAGPNKKTI